MEPKAILLACEQAVSTREFADAVDRLNDYYQWRVCGGVEPHNMPDADQRHGDQFADKLARRLSETLTRLLLTHRIDRK